MGISATLSAVCPMLMEVIFLALKSTTSVEKIDGGANSPGTKCCGLLLQNDCFDGAYSHFEFSKFGIFHAILLLF